MISANMISELYQGCCPGPCNLPATYLQLTYNLPATYLQLTCPQEVPLGFGAFI